MSGTSFKSDTRRLAYDQTPGRSPGVVFLSGFNSTKEGIKATFLQSWAQEKGYGFLRFDYSGHGASAGHFKDGTIGHWLEDTQSIIAGLTTGPQVIVGSSMGGWLGCLLLRERSDLVGGLVTIAAAPDFTEERYWTSFNSVTRQKLLEQGYVEVESAYDDGPYVITRKLIEEGRQHLVFPSPLHAPCPVRLLHGTGDDAIPVETAQRLFRHIEGADVQLTLVKGADHRFSSPDCLELIAKSVSETAFAASASAEP
ncbi:MAG: alpha/beta hydrolase [Pseudomonadota bacterium]